MIDIYLYGDIQLHTMYGTRYIGYYLITRKYIVEESIQQFTLNNKMRYLKNTIEFLKKLEENNLTYRDMKFENAGTDSDYNFVVLDYDDKTIITEDVIHRLDTDNNLGYAIGTYPFTYLIMNEQNYNYKYIYLSGLLDLVIELFKDNLSEKMLYDKTRKILLDITNVYRDYIRNYHYSNPIKKVLWYLSDNKTEYDKLKLNIASLITDLEKNKDKIDGLILQFCLACLVLSDDDIKPNFLIELKDYIDDTLLWMHIHNKITKEELKVRVLKLKHQLHTEHVRHDMDMKGLAHKYLNEVLDIIDEYRY